mmetsp:Transcript_16643/g.30133  ORF Transcript_16643/g.30133 Transcript_16643/m.30133 type:complete len:225 (-) Transcript_16643:240-914(-)
MDAIAALSSSIRCWKFRLSASSASSRAFTRVACPSASSLSWVMVVEGAFRFRALPLERADRSGESDPIAMSAACFLREGSSRRAAAAAAAVAAAIDSGLPPAALAAATAALAAALAAAAADTRDASFSRISISCLRKSEMVCWAAASAAATAASSASFAVAKALAVASATSASSYFCFCSRISSSSSGLRGGGGRRAFEGAVREGAEWVGWFAACPACPPSPSP